MDTLADFVRNELGRDLLVDLKTGRPSTTNLISIKDEDTQFEDFINDSKNPLNRLSQVQTSLFDQSVSIFKNPIIQEQISPTSKLDKIISKEAFLQSLRLKQV